MAGSPAETCRWKYHNNNKSVELTAFGWFFIDFKQTDARNTEFIKWSTEVYKPIDVKRLYD